MQEFMTKILPKLSYEGTSIRLFPNVNLSCSFPQAPKRGIPIARNPDTVCWKLGCQQKKILVNVQ